ncbi:MAG: hypothetical protein HRT69_14620 [Flavobacteriaceae bacterium]|nr:hypothetical protein [Flavobacteriaceae bacterium]
MKIYTSLFPPIKGEIGPKTEVNESKCKTCNSLLESNFYKKIEYVFDDWNGEDLVKGIGCYLVSDRLKRILEDKKLKGISFKEIIVTKGDYFKFKSKAYQEEIPSFFEIVIVGTSKGPDTWFKKGDICNECNKPSWAISTEGIKAMVKSQDNQDVIPRQVYRDSWNNEDAFKLEDPADPIFTENFINVLKESKVKDVTYKEAQWV